MKESTWLNAFSQNVTSQNGEDGIIEKVIETIGESDQWCVEFGACDGKNLSNTYNLIATRGFSAVLVEPHKKKWQELRDRFQDRSDVHTLMQFVGFGEDNLDAVLKSTDIPSNFDFLSIDIDGNDYHVWDAVQQYKPKIVCIEFNPTIPNEVAFVQPRDMTVSQGSSLTALTELANSKGYELVAVTDGNGIFVDAKYFPRFQIEDNSLAALRPPNGYHSQVFFGFDGTLFIRGSRTLVWHGWEFDEADVQPLPKILRRNRDHYNKLEAFLFRMYKRFHTKKKAA